MGILGILGILRIFKEVWDFLGIFGIFGDFRDFGISGDFRDFWDLLGCFAEFLMEKCESDFFGVIPDVSTKIQICQPNEFLSANKAGMCVF